MPVLGLSAGKGNDPRFSATPRPLCCEQFSEKMWRISQHFPPCPSGAFLLTTFV